MFLAEHLRLEPPHFGAVFPRVARQAGLVTRVREETSRRPTPLRRDLRQQQAALPVALDDQAVAADDDVGGAVDRFERAEQGDLDFQLGHFGEADRREARIGRGGGDRAARHDAAQRLVGLDVADAAAQLAVFVQRDEDAAVPFGNRPGDRGTSSRALTYATMASRASPSSQARSSSQVIRHSTVSARKARRGNHSRRSQRSPRAFSESTDRRRQVPDDAGLVARHVTGIRVVEDNGVARAELRAARMTATVGTAAARVVGLSSSACCRSIGVEAATRSR